MKKIIAAVTAIAIVYSVANAELLKNFKYDGKIEVNAYTTQNYYDHNSDGKDTTSDVDTRVQLNMGFDLNEDVRANVSIVKANRQYGDGSEHLNTLQNNLFVDQAYLDIKGVFGIDHKFGRQYYGNEGDLVIYYGPKGWPYQFNLSVPGANNLGVTGVDGWTGYYKNGKLDLTAALFKLSNSNTGVEDLDSDIAGLDAKYALNDNVTLGAYIYEKKDYNDTSRDDLTDVVGLKAFGKYSGFDYYAEYAKNYGKVGTDKLEGSAYLARLGYGMDLAGKIYFCGEYASLSGNDSPTKEEGFQSIAGDYRPGIIWGGDITTQTNDFKTWNLGVKWTPESINKLTAGAKYYNFTDEINGDAIGNELDIALNWNHSDKLGITAYYAMFDYDEDILGYDGDATKMLGAALNVKF
ncbi:MAG: alginate export family protein [Elusimicrobiota bacterium]